MSFPTAQRKYTTVIADDHEEALYFLQEFIRVSCPEIELVGVARDGLEAQQMLNAHKPDLALLDIDMPQMTGIEAAVSADHSPLVIFLTAHKEYAIESFQAYTVAFLVKPFKIEDLLAAIEKFKRMWVSPEVKNASLRASEPSLGSLKVSTGNVERFIPCSEIICCEACGKHSVLYTETEFLPLDKSLLELETLLPDNFFKRIHRQHIVNSSFIREIEWLGNSRGRIVLNIPFSQDLIISRENIDKFRDF